MNTETTKQLQGKLIDACDAMLGLVNMSSEQLVKIVSLERELAETKTEADKWEKLYDQDTEHLASLQKRDNYGPTETLNETAMRLSRELAAAKGERDALAEALEEVLEDYVFEGCVANSTMRKVEQALASVKGGKA